jgi:hypothetical protein
VGVRLHTADSGSGPGRARHPDAGPTRRSRSTRRPGPTRRTRTRSATDRSVRTRPARRSRFESLRQSAWRPWIRTRRHAARSADLRPPTDSARTRVNASRFDDAYCVRVFQPLRARSRAMRIVAASATAK